MKVYFNWCCSMLNTVTTSYVRTLVDLEDSESEARLEEQIMGNNILKASYKYTFTKLN